jgi:hypothetical protein
MELVIGALYIVSHPRDGEAVVRVLSFTDTTARLQMVNMMDSDFQIEPEKPFTVIREKCEFTPA